MVKGLQVLVPRLGPFSRREIQDSLRKLSLGGREIKLEILSLERNLLLFLQLLVVMFRLQCLTLFKMQIRIKTMLQNTIS